MGLRRHWHVACVYSRGGADEIRGENGLKVCDGVVSGLRDAGEEFEGPGEVEDVDGGEEEDSYFVDFVCGRIGGRG